jgi:hypothetical protein
MLARARHILGALAMVMAGFVIVGLSDFVLWFTFVSADVLSTGIVPRWLLPPLWWPTTSTLWMSRFSYLLSPSFLAENIIGLAVMIVVVGRAIRSGRHPGGPQCST